MQTVRRTSISREQLSERWQAIIVALVAHGINPDAVTVEALSLGADALAKNLGLDTIQRAIGFVRSKEQR